MPLQAGGVRERIDAMLSGLRTSTKTAINQASEKVDQMSHENLLDQRNTNYPFTSVLLLKKNWLDLILSGEKTWEIRHCNTSKRGLVGLGCKRHVYGHVEITDSFPADMDNFDTHFEKHQVLKRWVEYTKPHVWVMQNPVKFEEPLDLHRRQGQVVWVDADPHYQRRGKRRGKLLGRKDSRCQRIPRGVMF